MKISTKKEQTLSIDLDDTHITVSKAGSFNNKHQFLWTSISPTEGFDCDYESKLIDITSLSSRLDLIRDLEDQHGFTSVDLYAIDLFLKS